jgi:hypothetical protein
VPAAPLRHLLPTAVVVVALAAGASAPAQTGGTPPSPGQTPVRPDNPCVDKTRKPRLRCPDLVMWRPYDLFYTYTGAQVRLQAGNSIVNVGAGPAELLGFRDGAHSMRAVQLIRGYDGRTYRFSTGARLALKYIPGQGSYWKFRNAASFELWSVGAGNRLLRRVRTGPKLLYCLRDLKKRFWSPFSPPSRHFPACSQDPTLRSRVLGTSVGWSDDYPSSYNEQWIDVAGLRGRFAFFQVVDPLNHIHESNESNNRSPIVYLTLPPTSGGGPSSGGGY